MNLLGEGAYYKCFLCGSRFMAPAGAEECCKRAKAEILCDWLRQNLEGAILEKHCNSVRASVLAITKLKQGGI